MPDKSSNATNVTKAANAANTAQAASHERPRNEATGAPRLFPHPFRLRQDLIVSIQLPKDLTGLEANRLARFMCIF